MTQPYKNPRSELNEYCQARGLPLAAYETHDVQKLFSSRVTRPVLTEWSPSYPTKGNSLDMAASMALALLREREAPALRTKLGHPQAEDTTNYDLLVDVCTRRNYPPPGVQAHESGGKWWASVENPRPANVGPLLTRNDAIEAVAGAVLEILMDEEETASQRSTATMNQRSGFSGGASSGFAGGPFGAAAPPPAARAGTPQAGSREAPVPKRPAMASNYRCELNEYCQKARLLPPEYEYHEENQQFIARLKAPWSVDHFTMWHHNKSLATEEAAIYALHERGELQLLGTRPPAPAAAAPVRTDNTDLNYRCQVNEYCQAQRWQAPKYESREENQRFYVAPAYPPEIAELGIAAQGPYPTKAEGEEAAARQVMEALRLRSTGSTGSARSVTSAKSAGEEVHAGIYRSRLSEYCQKERLPKPDYTTKEINRYFYARLISPFQTEQVGPCLNKAEAWDRAAKAALDMIEANKGIGAAAPKRYEVLRETVSAPGLVAPAVFNSQPTPSIVPLYPGANVPREIMSAPAAVSNLKPLAAEFVPRTTAPLPIYPSVGASSQSGTASMLASTATVTSINTLSSVNSLPGSEVGQNPPAHSARARSGLLLGMDISLLTDVFLIDHDNCQDAVLSLEHFVLPPSVVLYVFHGAHVPVRPMPKPGLYVIESITANKNAADQDMAFVMGRLDDMLDRSIRFHIVSGDKAFGELCDLLRHLGRMTRVVHGSRDNLLELILNSNPEANSQSGTFRGVVRHVSHLLVSRHPARHDGLISFVKTAFKERLWEVWAFAPEDVVNELVRLGDVVLEGGGSDLKYPKIAARRAEMTASMAGGPGAPGMASLHPSGPARPTTKIFNFVENMVLVPAPEPPSPEELRRQAIDALITKVRANLKESDLDFPRSKGKALNYISKSSDEWAMCGFEANDVLEAMEEMGLISIDGEKIHSVDLE